MKSKVVSIVILFMVIAAFQISCSEQINPSNEIIYPEEGIFGDNLLSNSCTSIVLTTDADYFNNSIRAELPEYTSLKIIVRNVEHPNWAMAASASNGWIRTVENEVYPTFDLVLFAYGPEICDGGVRFDKSGSNTIEIYENNSSEPTRVKTISY